MNNPRTYLKVLYDSEVEGENIVIDWEGNQQELIGVFLKILDTSPEIGLMIMHAVSVKMFGITKMLQGMKDLEENK